MGPNKVPMDPLARAHGPGARIFEFVQRPGGPYLASARNLPLGEIIGTSFGTMRGPIRPFLKIGPTRVRHVKPPCNRTIMEPGLGCRATKPWAPGNGSQLSARKTTMGKAWTRTTHLLCVRSPLESFKSFEILESTHHKTLGFRPRWPPAVFSPEKQQPQNFDMPAWSDLIKFCLIFYQK